MRPAGTGAALGLKSSRRNTRKPVGRHLLTGFRFSGAIPCGKTTLHGSQLGISQPRFHIRTDLPVSTLNATVRQVPAPAEHPTTDAALLDTLLSA